MEMIEYLSRHVSDYSDKDEIAAYLGKILDKETFDRQGLIYGMGHSQGILCVSAAEYPGRKQGKWGTTVSCKANAFRIGV
jgi:hypothetical protein